MPTLSPLRGLTVPEFDLGYCAKREVLYVSIWRRDSTIPAIAHLRSQLRTASRRRYFTGPMHQALIDISRYVQGGWHEDVARLMFLVAMREAGLRPSAKLIADGRVQQATLTNRRGQVGKLQGWYVFIPGRTPAGAFGCAAKGQTFAWYSGPEAEAHRGTVEALQAQQNVVGGVAMATPSACVDGAVNVSGGCGGGHAH